MDFWHAVSRHPLHPAAGYCSGNVDGCAPPGGGERGIAGILRLSKPGREDRTGNDRSAAQADPAGAPLTPTRVTAAPTARKVVALLNDPRNGRGSYAHCAFVGSGTFSNRRSSAD